MLHVHVHVAMVQTDEQAMGWLYLLCLGLVLEDIPNEFSCSSIVSSYPLAGNYIYMYMYY